jgi:hypothetical protein
MKSVNTRFAMYYNEEEKRVGYVFRDRFRSEAIYNQEYLYKCLAYIHLNPVEAKIVVEPGDYKYSSYNDFIYRTGIASKENLRIIFGSSEDYMELFNFIHYGVYDFKDYKENKFDTDDEIHSFVDKYMKNISINSVNLFENNALLIELCRTLNNQGVSNSKIEELYHIKRKKIEGLYRRFPKGSVPLVKNLPKGSVPVVRNLPKGSVPVVKNLPKRSVPVVKNSPTGSVPVGKEVSDAS